MGLNDIKALPVLLMLLLLGTLVSLVPTEPARVGVMTPFYRTLQGMYGQ